MIKVTDDNFEEIKNKIIGKKIISIDRQPTPKEEWVCGQNQIDITLEDGTTINFYGWGYDASGIDNDASGIDMEISNG